MNKFDSYFIFKFLKKLLNDCLRFFFFLKKNFLNQKYILNSNAINIILLIL